MKQTISLLAAGFLCAATARAAVFAVGNLDQASSGGQAFTPSASLATLFTTGSGGPITLEGLTLSLSREVGGSGSVAITVSIYSDGLTQPGVKLVDLSGPTIPVGQQTPADFTFSGTLGLSPSTTYWVVLGGGASVGSGEVYWSLADFGGETSGGLPGWFISDARSVNAGLGWTTQVGPGRMAVLVPEPSGAMLVGLGIFGLIARRRR